MTWEQIKEDFKAHEVLTERELCDSRREEYMPLVEDQVDYCWWLYNEFDRPIGQRKSYKLCN